MARQSRTRGNAQRNVGDYRHVDAKRKNNPPAGIAPTYEVREHKTQQYVYDPHLDPRLQWAGKSERVSFEVDIVSLHTHERLSTRAILEAVKKPEPQIALFGETRLPLNQQIEFYQHDVNWANRLILGDSLLVMNSLLVKEGMAGKVQMVYLDPPYGINYRSNFQPRVDRRDVRDKDEDLTHEPEQIKAYRDTWKLGIHSYLTYLRDRFLLARELLGAAGSIFVQISDENLHLVRCLLDEVFGSDNFISVIAFRKTGGLIRTFLPGTFDFLLWYAKSKDDAKFHPLYLDKMDYAGEQYGHVQLSDGTIRRLRPEEVSDKGRFPAEARIFQPTTLESANPIVPFEFRGKPYEQRWKTNADGLRHLSEADRLFVGGKTLRYMRYVNDFPAVPLTDIWDDTMGEREMLYAVQTNTKVVERCVLMTTDPGDLLFDPTCGSGTMAYCAEKWGRRWLTCDTSRVALAIARQRLMVAHYDYYELTDAERGVSGGFVYATVPHVTLESITRNTEIDAIASRFRAEIDEALAELNRALRERWKEWEVSPEPGAKWPDVAMAAHRRFWNIKRQKRVEIDGSIQRNAPQEVLYDRPAIRRGVIRVSGPFTVEAIPVPAIENPSESLIPQFEQTEVQPRVSDPGGDYLATMLNLLKQQGGVLFPGGKKMELLDLRPLNVGILHGQAEAKQNGKSLRVAVSFGPQYGPVTSTQTDDAIRTARRAGYDTLVIAGFSIEAAAQAIVQETPIPGLSVHFANIAADALMQVEEAQGQVSLLKTTRASQVFTVFGQPDVLVRGNRNRVYVAELRGVDIFDPITGDVRHTRGDDVAAWFLDTDYDGMTFHICQAFFPGDTDAWEKLQKALRALIEPEAFEKMLGTRSFPFEAGSYHRIAVKVIDFRGNEVVRAQALP